MVTGGAGFVGSNLTRGLLARGHEVVVFDDFSTGYRSNLTGLDVELVEGSILDPVMLARAFRGADSVMHLAARGSVPRSVENPQLTNEINVTGTLNVLVAARDVGAYLAFSSSSSVYGANEVMPKVESLLPMPRSPYAVSKLAGESYVNAFQRTYGMPTLAFRFFNVFGPLQSARHPYAAVVPTFIAAMLDQMPLQVHGDGRQSRDFTSVDSVVDVLTHALERRVAAEAPVNLAFGTNTDLLDLVGRLSAILAIGEPKVDFVAPRTGDVRASTADNSALLALIPEARPVPLDEGLRRTVRWFEETGAHQA
ncbi:NAD-dependent epimerase/dehydratase family protein [Geodermatophilus sp. SYSU D00815]